MLLKSEGFASSLFDPQNTFTLAHYCTGCGIPYADTGLPVALETFSDYGAEFQRRFLPDLDERSVAAIEPLGSGFRLRLEDGETVFAGRVVVATGISHYAHLPEELSRLPSALATHSSDSRDLSVFGGREVIIVGPGPRRSIAPPCCSITALR
jgi:cation diffusion facilitator CzcD-associated flavoprotein CzcO